ncbi:hypothetical protein EC844_12431 [Acinetobacter calcoaceticus]|uniref:Uncharacterized protein n=1 Tax=Acinetobacter calcoaceticus TaxID=471 RepID=A0A4R1XSQ9_ACICA|nr:hypothetical protein EC844_12431 [Acinetobacter calcoaceticus]
MQPIQLTFNQSSNFLNIKHSALLELILNDQTFPKPYKGGESCQAPVYFDFIELLEWQNKQKVQLSNSKAHRIQQVQTPVLSCGSKIILVQVQTKQPLWISAINLVLNALRLAEVIMQYIS